jgi:hypothetical protein
MRRSALKPDRWIARIDQDHHGEPAVVCRNGSREFFFGRGWRKGKRVWICSERRQLFFCKILVAPLHDEAERAASVAAPEPTQLAPDLTDYLDLASES